MDNCAPGRSRTLAAEGLFKIWGYLRIKKSLLVALKIIGFPHRACR
jgi:hypothetical protein